ncbi:MAG: multicopper oxidase domain-containing protein, partial [Mycobacteriales bacterium]
PHVPGPAFAAGDIPNLQRAGGGQTNEGQTVLANGRNRGARAGSPETPGALAAGASMLTVQAGQGLRLQMINAAAVRYARLRLTDAAGVQVPLIRVGGEGGLLDAARLEGTFADTFDKYAEGEILLGPGNRADVVVKVPDAATGVLTLWTLDVKRSGSGFMNVPTVPVMHLSVSGAAASPYTIAPGTPLRTHASVNDPVEALGPASSPLVEAGVFGPRPGSDSEQITLNHQIPGPPDFGQMLGIDGVIGAHDGGGADYRAVPYQGSTRYAKVGDTLELTVKNDTFAHHPFHLHGFSMQPIDFVKGADTFTLGYHEFVDEIDVPAGATMRFRTRIDDRPMIDGVTPGGVVGRWVFHCHIFFHASIGMISEIVVVAADGNAKPFVNADNPSTEVTPPATAVMTGTYADPEGAAVTLAASDGVVTAGAGGTWSWEDTSPTAGPVYITATDASGLKAQDAFLVVIPNLPPTVTIDVGQPTTAAEGATFTVGAGFTDANSGGTYTATIDYGDGSGAQPATLAVTSSVPSDAGTIAGSHKYGDNGSYTVVVEVSDGEFTDTDSFVVAVSNVDPVVNASPLAASVEGNVVTVTATYSDKGWLDTHSATIDFGNGSGPQAVTPTGTTSSPPAATGSLSKNVTYGDNGTFTVTVSVTDDDGGVGTKQLSVTVNNVNPDGTIDETGTVLVNGVPTIFADAGQSVPFNAKVNDPGSDDLTAIWDWDDGTLSAAQTSLVNPPAVEPPVLPSPSVQPRVNIAFAGAHAFAKACLYDVGFGVRDDDGGTGSDTIAVIITGTPTLSRGAGYWQTAYKGTGGAGYSAAQLQCFLDIAAFLSDDFNEVRNASTIPHAYNDIFVKGLKGDMKEQLDRQLLAAWINFANGGVEYNEMLDTDNNGSLDTSFITVMTNAELVRLNPASTKAQLQVQRDILTRINGRDGL